MKTNIIAISGHIGSGKDEFAKILAELSDVPVERHAFADKVRDVTELIVGHKMGVIFEDGKPFYNTVYNYTQDEKNIYLPLWDKTIGECLQIIGTDLFRNHFDSKTWIKSLFSTTGKNCIDGGRILVIPDCRFPNEADFVLQEGGIVVRLEGDPLGIREKTKRDVLHPSETSLDNYQYFTEIIKNENDDINALKENVEYIIKKYLK